MTQLVGRDRPTRSLRAEIDRNRDSHGGLVFVVGEAGIGKTTLISDALAAERQTARVTHGTCWDSDSAPGYWPWIQVLRSLQRTVSATQWETARKQAGGELGALLGESADLPTVTATEGAFGISDAMTNLLVTLSREQPLIVVLDDLHWADHASLRLLEFVVRHAWFEQLLLIGAYRDVEVHTDTHPLRAQLTGLAAKATTITLTGVDLPEVANLMSQATGHAPDTHVIDAIHRRTGGNPFFVDQAAQLWLSTGSADGIPPQVQGAVERRLRLLTEPVLDLLRSASVIGASGHTRVLAHVTGLAHKQADQLMTEAATTRLLVPDGTDGWSFTHELVRESLYRSLDDKERQRRHARVVTALSTHSTSPHGDRERGATIPWDPPDPAEVAHHAYLAVPLVPPAEAIGHLHNATLAAGRRFAVDEAIGHLQRTLELTSPDEPEQWGRIALDLGWNQYSRGDASIALRTFTDVASLARKVGNPELLALAALRYRSLVWMAAADPDLDSAAADLIAEAYDHLPARGTGPQPAGSQPAEPDETPSDITKEQELTNYVLQLARTGNDQRQLIDALVARHDALGYMGPAAERLQISREITHLARQVGDRQVSMFAGFMAMSARIELGDASYSDDANRVIDVAGQMNGLFPCGISYWVAAELATLQGRFDEALTSINAMRKMLSKQPPDDYGRCGSTSDITPQGQPFPAGYEPHSDMLALGRQQEWSLLLLQGKLTEATETARAAGTHGHPAVDLLTAISAVESGDTATAQRYLDHVNPGYDTVGRWFDALWLRLRARVAARTGDVALAERARAELAALPTAWLVAFGNSVHGPVSYWTAVVDAAFGRWDDAITGFTAATRLADTMSSRPWTAESQLALAELLVRRGQRDDLAAAARLSQLVRESAAGLQLVGLTDRVEQLQATLRPMPVTVDAQASARAPTTGPAAALEPAAPAEALPPPEPQREQETNRFVLEHDTWTLTYAGLTVHVPDAKGLRDLHVLLSRPGDDIAASHLFAPEGGAQARAARQLGEDPMLDEQAKASYRKRLDQLDSQVDQALARRDDDRAAALDRERATLIEELRRSTGLGGRTRRLGSETERARKAVSERLRDTLRRLDRRHPPLAEHLRASVSIGTHCRYHPSSPLDWSL